MKTKNMFKVAFDDSCVRFDVYTKDEAAALEVRDALEQTYQRMGQYNVAKVYNPDGTPYSPPPPVELGTVDINAMLDQLKQAVDRASNVLNIVEKT